MAEFEGFEEVVQTFNLYKGKKGEDDDAYDDMQRVVGKFKV